MVKFYQLYYTSSIDTSLILYIPSILGQRGDTVKISKFLHVKTDTHVVVFPNTLHHQKYLGIHLVVIVMS